MQYNVSGLLKDGVGARRRQMFENERISGAGDLFTEVSGGAELLRTDRGILVQAEVTANTIEECSRCLGDAHLSLEIEFEDEFLPVNAFSGLTGLDEKRETEPLDPACTIDDDNLLDLREALRQALVTSIPMAPLCKLDCNGLCPTCSADRNLEPCKCKDTVEFPEWAQSLKSLKIG